jgi:hypothetical protein
VVPSSLREGANLARTTAMVHSGGQPSAEIGRTRRNAFVSFHAQGWGFVMSTWSIKRVVAFAVVASATVLGGVVDPAAADHPHDVVFPEGMVCADFGVGVDFGPDSREPPRVFTDANGNVRLVLAGRAGSVTLTRLDEQGHDTDITLTVGAKGSMWNIVPNSDGSLTVTTHGHLVFFIFPTDEPPGPSTTLYTGRVVFIQDGDFSHVLSHTGKTTDLCAALSD